MAIRKRTLRSGAVRYDVRLDLAGGGQISRTFDTRKAAERWERAYRAGLDRGEQVDLRAAASMQWPSSPTSSYVGPAWRRARWRSIAAP